MVDPHRRDPTGDPIRIVSKAKNNRLIELREFVGMTIVEAAHASGIAYTTYCRLESLNYYPGKKIAEKLSKYWKRLPEDLFPEYFKSITKTVSVRTVPENVLILTLTEAKRHLIADGSQLSNVEAGELKAELAHILGTLTPREEDVLRMRFGINGNECSLDEVARKWSVTKERIRQIEAKGIRKMRDPARKRVISEFLSKEHMEFDMAKLCGCGHKRSDHRLNGADKRDSACFHKKDGKYCVCMTFVEDENEVHQEKSKSDTKLET